MFSKPHHHAGAALLLVLCLASACSESEVATSPEISNPLPDSMVWWAANPQLGQFLTAVRDSNNYLKEEVAARTAGYRPSSQGCEQSADGAMGIHYGHPALLGLVPGSSPTTGTNAVIDPFKPEVLLFEPQEVGPHKIVAIEYVVYRAAWDAANPSGPPTLMGVPFDQKFGAEAHGHADHYELHVWLWRYNPRGMFSPWNPRVDC